jgi:hypothetical protein
MWGFVALFVLGDLGAAAGVRATERIQSRDLEYLGAFRLPTHGVILQGSWTDLLAWSKGVEAHYPDGDPGGAADGFPGSLFGVGHAWVTPAYEISIPAPVRSSSIGDLPVAELLQGPSRTIDDITSDDDELKGIEFLPAQGGMTAPKLHVSFGKHYQYTRRTTHGWTSLDLSNPQAAGSWFVGSADVVSDLNTNEYIFTIPKAWADLNAGGMRLACGRHREGQVATGPSVIAYAPWESGNPPPPGTQLAAKPLVLYRDLSLEDGIDDHCWADNWTGGAWLDDGEKAAVVIVGNKGYGDCWYGWPDGMTAEECEQLPGGCEANGYFGDNRGYCASYFRCVILFYDPFDLARVAHGTLASYDIQPYLVMDITPYMLEPQDLYEIHLGGVAYDTENGFLYVTERYGDQTNSKPIVHVFATSPVRHAASPGTPDPVVRDPHADSGTALVGATGPLEVGVSLDRAAGIASIRMAGPAIVQPRRATVHDVLGRLVQDLGETTDDTFTWPTHAVSDGVYFVRVQSGSEVVTRKVVLVN